jgi:hypothetical protein
MMLGEAGRYGDTLHAVYSNETVIPWYPVDHWQNKNGMPPSYLSTAVPWNNGWSHDKGMNYVSVDGSGHFLRGFSDIPPASPELEEVWYLK